MTASPTPNIGTFEKVQVEYRKKQLVLFSYTFKHSVKSLGNIVNISSGSPVDEVWVNGIRYVAEKEEWGAWKIVSDMLDKPGENGIYPTSECYQKLYEFVCNQKQQLLESLLEEVKKLETKEYLAGSPEYHRQKALNKVKALIQSKKNNL